MNPTPPQKHRCGYPITRVLPRSIHRQELMIWFDAHKDSPTYRKEIAYCPGCGEKLPEK